MALNPVVKDPIRHYVNANYLRPEAPDYRLLPYDFKAAFTEAVEAIRNKRPIETGYLFDNGGMRTCKKLQMTDEPVFLTEDMT